jgi:hypothetical protein
MKFVMSPADVSCWKMGVTTAAAPKAPNGFFEVNKSQLLVFRVVGLFKKTLNSVAFTNLFNERPATKVCGRKNNLA